MKGAEEINPVQFDKSPFCPVELDQEVKKRTTCRSHDMKTFSALLALLWEEPNAQNWWILYQKDI